MTDEQIITELKDEIGRANYLESYYIDTVNIGVFQHALALINRQKAEIERLKRDIAIHKHVHEESNAAYQILVKQAKNQAIHEFVKKFKDRVVNKYEYVQVDIFDELDNFTKEMTG